MCVKESGHVYMCVSHMITQVTSQLDTFRKHLEIFASKHKNDIRKNGEFRGHFQQMCARIGVDPLACECDGLRYIVCVYSCSLKTNYFVCI